VVKKSKKRLNWTRWTVAAGFLLLTLILLFSLGIFDGLVRAQSGPDIEVTSSFSGKPLLGGTATLTVTITNDEDADRGYNLGFAAHFSDLAGYSFADGDNIGQFPEKTIRFVSASLSTPIGSIQNLIPLISSFDPVTGDLYLYFDDLTDLEPGESATINIEIELPVENPEDDNSWEVGEFVYSAVQATINPEPDGSGDDVVKEDTASAKIIPIALVTKSANQSTVVEQATGTEDRKYTYTLTVQNNFVAPSEFVYVEDTIPDGIEYLGISEVKINGTPQDIHEWEPIFNERDPVTGIRTLRWKVQTDVSEDRMNAEDTWELTYEAGIRYDYFGTAEANGGKNRDHNDFSDPEMLGRPIPHQTDLRNDVSLEAEYKGYPYFDDDFATVTAAYATVNKSVAIIDGGPPVGNGTRLRYTITYYTSEYYEIGGADPEAIKITDTLGDGQTYQPGSSSITPDEEDIVKNLDGTTTIVWSNLDHLPKSDSASITFEVVVDEKWSGGDLAGKLIVAGDSVRNSVILEYDWDDLILDRDGRHTISCECESRDGAGVSTELPKISKEVVSFDGDNWVPEENIEATVGDELYFRMRFNTTDGENPYRSDIQFGDISMTDWLPPGMAYEDNSAVFLFSSVDDFNKGEPINTQANFNGEPYDVETGSLKGLRWIFGDVLEGGWWEVIFKVVVDDDDDFVKDGVTVDNYAKMAGENSFKQRYSDRDIATVKYIEPILELEKANAPALEDPLVGGSDVEYTLTIINEGSSPAHRVNVKDILPEGMRENVPTGVAVVRGDGDGVPSDPAQEIADTNYTVDTDQFLDNGIFTITFKDDINIPAAESIIITYTAISAPACH